MKNFVPFLFALLLLPIYGCSDQSSNKKVSSNLLTGIVKRQALEKNIPDPKNQVDAGDAQTQYSLGNMYYFGEGAPKDIAKAVGLWQKAALQGYADAQSNLGLSYFNGDGIPKDTAKAVEWYKKAAEQGNAQAQSNLAIAYFLGEGAPQDTAKAVDLWQKAAVRGNASAQYNLGKAYYNGIGVPRDISKAIEWYQKAAAQGDEDAQINLGIYYFKRGKDNIRAYALFNLVAAQGNERATKWRNFIEKSLTPAEREEGKRLASKWKIGYTLAASGTDLSGSAASDNGNK